MSPEELVRRAKELGMDGVCLTEHNKTHDPSYIRHLGKKYGMVVLQGVEMVTLEGDILLFSEHLKELLEEIREVISVRKMRSIVNKMGGAIIAAHPLRNVYLSKDSYQTELYYQRVEEVSNRVLLRWVDGIEVYNGNDLDIQNLIAWEVSKQLQLVTTGGSDAHCIEDVGKFFTIFEGEISCEADLVAALREGKAKAGSRESLKTN